MSLTAGRHWPAQGVKLTGLTKKSVFRAENGIFFKSSFYTKMICDPKYNFSLGQKYLVVASFKVCIFHQIQPNYDGATIITLYRVTHSVTDERNHFLFPIVNIIQLFYPGRLLLQHQHPL